MDRVASYSIPERKDVTEYIERMKKAQKERDRNSAREREEKQTQETLSSR